MFGLRRPHGFDGCARSRGARGGRTPRSFGWVTITMTTHSKIYPFSDVSRLDVGSDGSFEANVNGEWTIGGKPNGGYLLSLLGRAAVVVGSHPHVVAASAHYLRSPDPGTVKVEAEVLRSGRSASQVSARLVQNDQKCVEALADHHNYRFRCQALLGRWDAGTLGRWDAGTLGRWDAQTRNGSVGGLPAAGARGAGRSASSDYGAGGSSPREGVPGIHKRPAHRAGRTEGLVVTPGR
jgi:hypothetical protein